VKGKSMKKISAEFLRSLFRRPPAATERKDVTIEPIAHVAKTIAGQAIDLPRMHVTVGVSLYTIQAGVALPAHRHRYPRYGYVLDGELQVTNEESGQTAWFQSGHFIVESINQWHSGLNTGRSPLRLLVIDQAPDDECNVEVRR
jgi:quercetin dioxygenase-like cupin family protein